MCPLFFWNFAIYSNELGILQFHMVLFGNEYFHWTNLYVLTLLLPYPPSLAFFHRIWPLIQPIQLLQHLRCIFDNIKIPLAHLPLLSFRSAPPGPAKVINLFIGQNRLINRIPVYITLFFLYKTIFHHCFEKSLCVLVVLLITGANF